MPWRAKMVGILSLILWLGVVIAGTMDRIFLTKTCGLWRHSLCDET